MNNKLGKMVQKSKVPFGERLGNFRLKYSSERAKRSTFALLERACDVRRKPKVATDESAKSCEKRVRRFGAPSVQKSCAMVHSRGCTPAARTLDRHLRFHGATKNLGRM
jgi:hypothetical protein